MDDCPERRRSIVWLAMRRAWIAIVAVLAVGLAASPAAAMPDWRNARPAVLSAELARDGAHVTVTVVGRDRDDVVRGAEIYLGRRPGRSGAERLLDHAPRRADERRRGKKESFELSYDYPAAGHYEITVRVFSGGCGRAPAAALQAAHAERARRLSPHRSAPGTPRRSGSARGRIRCQANAPASSSRPSAMQEPTR